MKRASSPRPVPDVHVEREEETVDVRAFARTYVHVLLSLEGVALEPAPLQQAS
jgi:hypothetical protein